MTVYNISLNKSSGRFGWKALLLGIIMAAAAGHSFGQAMVTNNGALIAIKPGAIMIIKTGPLHNGTLVNNAGFVGNQGTLTIEKDLVNNATVIGGDTATGGSGRGLFNIGNNWENNSVFIADTSVVVLDGDSQLITGTAVTTFYDLKLTGSGVKTQTVDANVTDSLVLNNLELATDDYKMHVMNPNNGAISKAAGDSGFVSSLDSGRLVWDMNTTLPYIFPLGSSVGTPRYRPIEVRPITSAFQTFDARLANDNATTEGYNLNDKQAGICQINPLYFHLVGSNSSNAVQLTFFYDPIADTRWDMVAHWQNVPDWQNVGSVTSSVGLGFNTLTIPGWSSFSTEPFALGRTGPAIDSASLSIVPPACYGGSGTISDTANGGTPPYTFSWPPSADTSEIATGLVAGTYSAVVTDAYGCSDTLRNVVMTQPPQIELSTVATNVTCNGGSNGSLDLVVDSAALPIASYLWSNSSTSPDLTNVPAGTYTVRVTDAHGCQGDSTFSVSQPSALEVAPTLTNLNCYKGGGGQISVTVSGGTGMSYTYHWSDSSTVDEPNRLNLSAGTYYVTITDANGCPQVDSFTLTQPDSLYITLARHDTIIALGYSAPLDVVSSTGGTGSLSYSWTPAANLSDTTGPSTVATPPQTTTYTVVGKDANNCIASDTEEVIVDVSLVTVPDGFVPNGNNPKNRVFALLTSPTVQVVELKIFNRWGQLISENVSGWDGTYNGKPQPMDTYVYEATIRMPDGTNVAKSGDFILIR